MKRILCVLLIVVGSAPAAHAGSGMSLRDAVPVATDDAERAATWTGWSQEAVVDDRAPLTPARAVLYSLLLPGLGDYRLGNRSRAAAFFAAEGLIWVSFAVFEVQGHQREDEYQQLAVRFAGVSRTGHSDEFYARLREYDSSEEYEADVKLDGRIDIIEGGGTLEDIGADALDRYFEQNRLSDYEPWQWVSLERRLQYSEVRSSSKTSYRRADYMLAAAAANRVVSAIVAFASARGMRDEPPRTGYRLDIVPAARGVDLSLTVTRSF